MTDFVSYVTNWHDGLEEDHPLTIHDALSDPG